MTKHNLIDDTVPQRVARYADLMPYKDSMNNSEGIPPEAMLMMSPDKVMPIMSPKGWGPSTVDAMAKVGIRFGEPA